MNIQYYGHSCFKISVKPAGRGQEEVVFFIDPFDKSVGLRPPQGSADFVLVTHNHPDHNNVEALKGEPRVIDLPGEYSIKGVNIIGIPSYHDAVQGKEKGLNTIYLIESEEIKICHLGDLGHDLDEKQLEKINTANILMIPIGGKYTLDYKKAIENIKKIEPNIIIPIHFKMKNSATDVDDESKFCLEMGYCAKERPSKLNLKSKDFEGKNMEIIVMGIE
ncbi:MAG TPA: lactamase [Candidatus Moranbacteria bacterium]|nr:lactamase [Candidatus Moranbacteria bacterium]HAT74818.1 lactamase [Candidatus Moranbacteria bacterium]